jgi:hypothetical protein
MASHPNGPPPFFTAASGSTSTAPVSGIRAPQLNLDDIFGDVVFTPDGDTVFLSEEPDEILNSGEKEVTLMASKPKEDGQFAPVQKGGGLYTTNLHDGQKASLTMGAAGDNVQATELVPFKQAPQKGHHLQYAAPKKKSKGKKSEEQQSDRR